MHTKHITACSILKAKSFFEIIMVGGCLFNNGGEGGGGDYWVFTK